MGEKRKRVRTVTISVDTAQKQVQVSFTPKPNPGSGEDLNAYLNGLSAGMRVAFAALLQNVPMLRPATQEEMDAHIYVFKNEGPDNQQYNLRKKLYNSIAAEFAATLREAFPDVEYIDTSLQYQQELALDMSSEDAENHRLKIAEVVENIRKDVA